MLNFRTWLAKFMKVFGYFMVTVYIVLGVLFFIPQVYPTVPKNLKFVFALFFISYGLFRLTRMLSRKKEFKD
jgi:hypothetical protein